MNTVQAIIMGLVQGLTEFLPISSSGHLAIFRNILGINLEGGILFEVILHGGTLIAIFIALFNDIKHLVIEGIGIVVDFAKYIVTFINNLFIHKKKELPKIINSDYRKFVMLIIIANVPTAIIGLLLESTIESAYTGLLIPGVSLLITGSLLLITTQIKLGHKKERNTKYKDALIVGTFQGFATMPGISRSGSTLVAGLLTGMEKEFALRFSFIMSIPAVLGAMVLKITDVADTGVGTNEIVNYLIGMLVAAIVGYLCIKGLFKILGRNKIHYFSYYCFTVGLLAIIGHFII